MDPLLFEQLGQALRNDDAETRYKAIIELAQTGEAGAVRMALSHVRTEGKIAILQVIGKMAQKIKGDWEPLIQSQLDISDSSEKCRILFVMSFLNDPKLQLIAADLFGESDMAVKKAALKVLGKLDKDQKLKLFRKLLADQEQEKRLRAVKSIVAFKHKDVVPVLKTGMRDKDYEIRLAAWNGLIKLNEAGISEAGDFLKKSQKPVPPEKPEVEELPEEAEKEEEENSEPEFQGSSRNKAVERLLSEGKTCKDCIYSKRERTDKQKMAPMRKWCVHLKKEVLPKHTCIRGKWN